MTDFSEDALERLHKETRGAVMAGELPHRHISLKQWNTLLAVVRNGSFARAAEALHISQPAISYTIAKIEERLGMPLLRPDGRRARITDIGRQLLAHVEPLVRQAAQVETIARQLRASCRPEIRLAVVEEFPIPPVLSAIRSYSDSHPGATVLVTKGSADVVHRLLHNCEATLAITMQLPEGMHGDVLVETEYVPVAHARHPLFALGRPLSDADFLQVIEVRVGADEGPDAPDTGTGEKRQRSWNVSNVDTAEKALAEGIGYGWLPRHQIQASLTAGRLAVLPVSAAQRRTLLFYLGYRTPDVLSGDVRRLIVSLRAATRLTCAPARSLPEAQPAQKPG